MRVVNKQQALFRRFMQNKLHEDSLIQLPEEFLIGKNAESSKFRIGELIDGPENIPTGARVIVHEAMSQSLELIGEKVHRAPIEFVLAYIDKDDVVHPLQNLVLVKPDPKEENIPGSFLLMPEYSRRPATTGTVLALGPDCKYVEVGNKVAYALFSGVDFDLNGETFLLVREMPLSNQYADELLGVLE